LIGLLYLFWPKKKFTWTKNGLKRVCAMTFEQTYIKYVCISYCGNILNGIYFSSNPQTVEGLKYE
jgi:hypothetical protein